MKRILLVDDDELVRETSQLVLQSMGHDVVTAVCGQDALQLLRSSAPFDYLFTDLMMPNGMSGVDLASDVRSNFPETKIVLVSGNLSAAHADELGKLGNVERIEKPFGKSKLRDVLGE